MRVEDEMEELIEGEAGGVVVGEEHLRHDLRRVGGGAPLVLQQELVQLLRLHVGPSLRVLFERRRDLRRRVGLADLEFPVVKSKHPIVVVTLLHFPLSLSLFVSKCV